MKKTTRCLVLLVALVLAYSFAPQSEAALPTETSSTSIRLPEGQTSYKIEIAETGLYRIGYADLLAAGMPVDVVNPATFEMMTAGQSVAYQFDGDGDARFEPNESILFYAWAFDGPRPEQQYVTNNVFWLWANGTPSVMGTVENVVNGEAIESVSAEIHTEPENYFSTTYTHLWHTAPNDFDPWYWDRLTKPNADPSTHDYTIELPNVAARSEPAFLTVEVVSLNRNYNHIVAASVNGGDQIEHEWQLNRNTNITGTIPHDLLRSGTNDVALTLNTAGADSILLNRISVEYQRALVADSDTLDFRFNETGKHTFYIDQFSESDAANVVALNVSDRNRPQAIAVGADDVTAAKDGYRYRVGATTTAGSQFFVTTLSSTLVPAQISSYEATPVDPVDGAAWLAVTHELFSAETNRLAAYRTQTSQLTTHVVDVQDVINQFGFGLPTPHGIQQYLQHAMESWPIAPQYVVLVGDATMNPRQQACEACSDWSTAEQDFVPTFLEPVDRSIGMVPVDHYYSTLVGDDDVPDVSLGRLPVSTEADIQALVNKIMRFEANLGKGDQRQKEMLFVADNADSAGDFCEHISANRALYSAEFTQTQVCLDETPVDELRDTMFDKINDGVLTLTYLGHGFIDGWASEGILRTKDTERLTNDENPFVQISGNCLDGHFAWPGIEGISETLLSFEGGGSAAHWGATGLGYLYEHNVLHDAMVEALQDHGKIRIGDAIRHSKTSYLDTWFYAGQAYSSTLLGDPAMPLMMPDLAVSQRAAEDRVDVGETIHFEMEVSNRGNYPADTALVGNVSDGLRIVETVVPLSFEISTQRDAAAPNEVAIELSEPLQPGQTVVIGVHAQVIDEHLRGSYVSATTTIAGDGPDANPDNDSGTVVVDVGKTVPLAVALTQVAVVQSHHTLVVAVTTAALTLITVLVLREDFGRIRRPAKLKAKVPKMSSFRRQP